MSGYSGTPLPKKLGIKPGARVLLAGAPADFTLEADADVHRRASGQPYDVIIGFCPDHATLLARFTGWRGRLAPTGGLWIAWPKKASGLATDLTDSVVREHGLTEGLVDNKVCAIDETWSGLRFVVRLRDR